MAPETTKLILDLIAEAKVAANSPQSRVNLDMMAVGIITQEQRPLVMADNLQHWLRLSPSAIGQRGSAALAGAWRQHGENQRAERAA